MAKFSRRASRIKRHRRIRNKVFGTAERPRLCVYRSLNHIHAQVINDEEGRTLAAASSSEPALKGKLESTKNREAAKQVGLLVAGRAKEQGVTKITYDRGGYIYHGRIAALADGAREGGLDF